MAITYNDVFGTANSKVSGTSITVTGLETVAVGDDLFVAVAWDAIPPTPILQGSHTGTASITWTLEKREVNAGDVETWLVRGNVTGAGTVLTVTISYTGATGVTAKAAVVGWYSGVGTKDGTSADTGAGTCTLVDSNQVGWQTDDLVIGAGGFEGPGTDDLTVSQLGATLTSLTEVGQDGTTGQGATSNITAILGHGFATGAHQASNALRAQNATGSREKAGAGAVYSPAGGAQTHQLEADLAMTMQVDTVMRQVFRWAADLALTAQVDTALSQIHQIEADLGLTAGIDTSLSRIAHLESDLALLAAIDSDLNRIAAFASDLGLTAQVDSTLRQVHRVAADLALTAQIDSLLRQINKIVLELGLTGQIDTALTQINKLVTDLVLTAQIDSVLSQTLGAVSSTGIVVYAGGLGAESNGSTYGAGTLGGALNTASYPP